MIVITGNTVVVARGKSPEVGEFPVVVVVRVETVYGLMARY
jgi:hypothetical protein